MALNSFNQFDISHCSIQFVGILRLLHIDQNHIASLKMKTNSISRRAYRCHDSQTGACVCFTDTNYDSDLLLCISFLFARQRLVEQLSKI